MLCGTASCRPHAQWRCVVHVALPTTTAPCRPTPPQRSGGEAHAYARPLFPTPPPSAGPATADAASGAGSATTPLAASPTVPSVAAATSANRRNVVYARRTTPEPEFPAAGGSPVAGHVSKPPAGEDMYGNQVSAPGGGGGGATQGLSSVPVEVPKPPEAFQQLAARHGIVLPGPEHVAAEEEAARQLEAAGARPGAVPLPPSAVAVAMTAGVPYTPVPTFVQDTPAEPPPYKRLHYAEGGQGEGAAVGRSAGVPGAAASPRSAPVVAAVRAAVDNGSSGKAMEPPVQLPVAPAAMERAAVGGGGAGVLDSGDFVRAATSSGGGSMASGSSGRDSGGGSSGRTRPAGGSETSWEDIGSVGSPARQQGAQAAGAGAGSGAGSKQGGAGRRRASEATGGEAGSGAAEAGVKEQPEAAAGVVGGAADVATGAGGSQGGGTQGVRAGTKAGAGGSAGGSSGGGSGGGVQGERSGGGSKSKHKKKGGKGK